jgi:predicted  nucleic acid-binding Zn-ribbon protein
LDKLAASVGELQKRAASLEAQLADLDERLTRIEEQDDLRGTFPEATVLALAVAHWHQAPEGIQ